MNFPKLNWRNACRLLAVSVLCCAPIAHAQTMPGDLYSHPMLSDPSLQPPTVIRTLDPLLLPLWINALGRPDVATRRQAAEAIAKAASIGTNNLDAARQPLLRLLQAPDLQLRLAAANALIAMKDPSLAEALLAADAAPAEDAELKLLIDPVLATFQTSGAEALFLQRLSSREMSPPLVRSAATQLGLLHGHTALSALKSMVVEASADPGLRLVAATSLSQICPDANLPTANELLKIDSPILIRLVAATLLSNASDSSACSTLLSLAQDTEPAVAAVASKRVFELDPLLLAPLDATLVTSPDSSVRMTIASSLYLQHTHDAAVLLVKLLGDFSRNVSEAACVALIHLDADLELRFPLRQAATRLLDSTEPRAIGGALLYLGMVHEPSITDRATSLLADKRHVVRRAAILALRSLALPETLPAQRHLIDDLFQQSNNKRLSPQTIADIDEDLTYSLENLGIARDSASDAAIGHILEAKAGPLILARSAAAWSLGKIHQDHPTPAVAALLLGRLNDRDSEHPELSAIRAASAVALGCCRATQALPALHANTDLLPGNLLGVASRWAIAQITRQPWEQPPPLTRPAEGWFLESVR